MYTHVLRATDDALICDHCPLWGEEYTENWEDFLNGKWTRGRPKLPGWYPVKTASKLVYLEAIRAGNKVVWVDTDPDARPTHWSHPIPTPHV